MRRSVSDAHRVVAALADNDSAGKGLVVDLNAERPVSTVQSVLLDEVQVVYTGNLHVVNERRTHRLHIKNSNTKMLPLFCNLLIATAAPLLFAQGHRRSTRLRSRGASTSITQRLSVTNVDPSSLRLSLMISLSTNTGIRGHLGNLLM